MAIIPSNEKVFMVSNSTNTTYSGSAALQAMQQWYTMGDIIDSVKPAVVNSIYNFSGSLPHTGNTTITNLLTILIPANSLSEFINIPSIMFEKVGIAGGCEFALWKNTTNNFATATQIAFYSFSTATNVYVQMSRQFTIASNTLIGFPAAPGNATGTGTSSGPVQATPFNPTVDNYLFVSVKLGNAADTIKLRNIRITD